MGTRIYFPVGVTTGFPSVEGLGWNRYVGGSPRWGSLTKGESLGNISVQTETLGIRSTCVRQFLYGPLQAQTISGWTCKGMLRSSESNNGANCVLAFSAAIVRVSGGSLLTEGTLVTPAHSSNYTFRPPELAVGTDPGFMLDATRRFQNQSGMTNVPLNFVVVPPGAYLLVSIGFAQNTTQNRTVYQRFGSTGTDLPETTYDVDGAPWIEFSGDLGLMPPPSSGVLASTLAAAGVVSSGVVAPLGILGSLSSTLGAALCNASGMVEVGTGPSGGLNATLGALTCLSSSQMGRSGTFAETLGAASLSSMGTVLDAGGGSLTVTLDNAVVSATGSIAPSASLAATLGPVTVVSYGGVTDAGSIVGGLNSTLEALTGVGTGSRGISGQLNVTLDGVTLVATGAGVAGQLDVVLDDALVVGTAQTGRRGQLDALLDSLQATALGELPILGGLVSDLEELVLASSGAVLIQGTVDADLCPSVPCPPVPQRMTVRFITRTP